VCVQKDAVVILNPDGTYADDLGVECRTTYMGPDRMAGVPPILRP
jgi:hypothetical protein